MGCAGQARYTRSVAGPGPAVRSSRRARGWALLRGVLKRAGVAWRRTRGLWVLARLALAQLLLWDGPALLRAVAALCRSFPVAGALCSRSTLGEGSALGPQPRCPVSF